MRTSSSGDTTAAMRSALMARIRDRDTKPEIGVRRLLFSRGYRYRLHRRDLPGTPDIAFPGRKKVIFVHGCFWHRHEGCSRATIPTTRREFWLEKFRANVERDRRKIVELSGQGWSSLVVWECEIRDQERLATRLERYLR